MPFEQVTSGRTDPSGTGRVYAGQVTLSSGTATINYADDLPGTPTFTEEPVIVTTPKGGDAVFVSSAGAAQATLDDGSGSSSTTVNVVIHEQGGD